MILLLVLVLCKLRYCLIIDFLSSRKRPCCRYLFVACASGRGGRHFIRDEGGRGGGEGGRPMLDPPHTHTHKLNDAAVCACLMESTS